MPASPNLSHRIRNEVDEIYTFPIIHDHLNYNTENSAVLVKYEDDGTATVVLKDPPGRQGYFEDMADIDDDDPARRARCELANELVEYAEKMLTAYDPQTSHWKANSGNRSLTDIYVNVDSEEVDAVILKMWHLLIEYKPKYITYLQEHESEKLVSPTGSLTEKVDEIAGGLDQPYDAGLD